MKRPWAVLAIAATGCTWLGRGQLDERLEELDEDRDGVSIEAGDCAPLDPNRSPELEEIPYDRSDNDCDELVTDLLDVDQDGFPGISQEDYEALPGDLEYPVAYVGKAVDCNDTDRFIYPESSYEQAYDGVDGDCLRDNDYDADRDGYYAVRFEGSTGDVGALIQEYIDRYGLVAESGSWGPGGVGPSLAGDCDDLQRQINPGVVDDGFYDGSDDNCDDVNDFDQDGDGFMDPQWAEEYAFYVQRYYGDQPPPFQVDPDPFRDCADDIFGPVATLEIAAQVYPGAPETWYDGIDADCAGDNDFDQDVDGWMPDGLGPGGDTLQAMREYAVDWDLQTHIEDWAPEGAAQPGEGDCDDEAAEVHPTSLERLGDALDSDCNLSPDLAEWGFGNSTRFSWAYPTNPELVRLRDDYLLLVTATETDLTGRGAVGDLGSSFRFRLDSAAGGAPPTSTNEGTWKGGNQNLLVKRRLDVGLAPSPVDLDNPPDGFVDPEAFILVPAFLEPVPPLTIEYSYLYLGAVRAKSSDGLLGTRNTFAQYTGQLPQAFTYTARGIDVTVDDRGDPFAVACAMRNQDNQTSQVVHALYSAEFPALDGYVEAGGDTCFFDGVPRIVGGTSTTSLLVCPSAQTCTAVDMAEGQTAPAFVNQGPVAGETWLYGDNDDGFIALLNLQRRAFVRDASAANPVDLPLFAGGGGLPTTFVKDPNGIGSTLDVSVHDGAVYAIAILENQQVWLQYGPTGAVEYLNLDFLAPAGTGVPTGVAVWADQDRVAVAVSSTEPVTGEGSVGWMFLGTPAP